jgi:hAT family C-terminal dimerisation region
VGSGIRVAADVVQVAATTRDDFRRKADAAVKFLKSAKSKTSVVHLVFKTVVNNYVYCPLICEVQQNARDHGPPNEAKFSIRGQSGMSKHWRHLRRNHPQFLINACDASKKGRVEKFVNGVILDIARRLSAKNVFSRMSSSSAPPLRVWHSVLFSRISQATQLMRHGQSFNCLTSLEYAQGYVDLGLDASAALPQTFFKRTLMPTMLAVCQNRVRAIFSRLCSVSLTADAWTSRNGEPFLGVTAHFVDEQWKLRSCTLDLIYAPSSHSANNLKDLMMHAVDMYAGEHLFITGVVVDGARAALNSAVYLASSENMLWCAAHRLALVVGDVLKCHGAVISDVRSFIAEVRNSTKLRIALKDYQKKEGVTKPRMLSLDVATRWCSTYTMLKRFADLFSTMTKAFRDPRSLFDLQPENEHFVIARVIARALEPVTNLVTCLQTTSYSCLSALPLWIEKLQNDLALIHTLAADEEQLRGFVQKLQERIQMRFATIYEIRNPIMRACAFSPAVDVEAALSNDLQLINDLWRHVEEEAFLILGLVPDHHAPRTSTSPRSSPLSSPSSSAALDDDDDDDDDDDVKQWSQILGDLDSNDSNNDKEEQQLKKRREEASNALKQLRLMFSLLSPEMRAKECHQDPLYFWGDILPKLHSSVDLSPIFPVARAFLSVPATSAASESLFSVAGFHLSARRSQLKPNSLRSTTVIVRNLPLFDEFEDFQNAVAKKILNNI